ncbi:META domain-containing protein [Nocardia lasii]|uniref:META domain-containing protein n=1 Tax=Nocardia lasii TaxID=1616107 RepID=A0ABW1JU02_9NOCA
MRITPARLAVLALIGTGVLGCGSPEQSPEPSTATPMGKTYISTAVDGDPIPGGGPLTLSFTDGRISANSGCNSASGSVDLSDHTIRTSPLAGTLMACPGDRGEADAWQHGFLESAPTWRLDGDELTLTGENSTVRLTDKKVLTPDKPLTGTDWVVTGMLTPDAQVRSTALDEAGPNLTISADGTLTGSTGCNRMTGTALVDGATVTFTVATTRMMCAEDVMEIEQNVLRALDGRATATVDADQLTLRNDNGFGLSLRAR